MSSSFPEGALAQLPAARRGPLAARADRCWSTALSALEPLYGSRGDWREVSSRVAECVARHAASRDEDLCALDAAREADPAWFQRPDVLGYSTYVDRFAGTLAGVAEKADYLEELGVRYLHLLPIFRSQPGDSDGGFAVADHLDVDPRWGTVAELADLAARLRGRKISLCLDFVMNHTAAAHRWAEAARAGDPRYLAYYLTFADRELPDRYEATLPEVFPDTAPGNFTWVPEIDRWVWTTFYPFQWDLDWSNPAVFLEMLDVMLGLADLGVEVLRVDSAAFVWKRMGTDCRNQPEAHLLLRALRALAEIAAPALVLKAEAIVPARQVMPYFGEVAPECHLAYHNTLMAALWMALASGRTDVVATMIRELPALPPGTAWITYLRCHDDIGWGALEPELGGEAPSMLRFLTAYYAGESPGSLARGRAFQTGTSGEPHGTNGMLASLAGLEVDAAQGYARVRLLYGVLFGFSGLPVVYMGDEVGLLNDLVEPHVDGRWLHRPAYPWGRADARRDPATREGRVWSIVRDLWRVRRGLAPMHSAAPVVALDAAPGVLAFARETALDRIVVAANFTADARPAPVPPHAVDLLTGRLVGDALPPYGVVWAR